MSRVDEELFIQALSSKVKDSRTNKTLMTAVTVGIVPVDATTQTLIDVDLDPFGGGVSTVVRVKMTKTARESLRGEVAGQKVLIGSFGNFYCIVDVIL